MDDKAIQNTEYWENLYNQKDICEALLLEGAEVAKVLFKKRVQTMATFDAPAIKEGDESAFVLLTSLNRCIYTYLLLNLNISLARCCFECRAHTHSVSDAVSLLEAGYSIIDHYAANLKENMAHYHFIKNVCGYIQAHLEDELTIERICDQMFVSRSYLCRNFKELTGSTFCKYLTQQRLSRARILLTSTSLSIDEIASKCGFRSQAYFSSVFKGEMGMTPSVFRREIRVS